MRTLDALPATADEIAAIFGVTAHQASARLNGLKRRGLARRIPDRKLRNANQGLGPHHGSLWVRVALDGRENES